MPPFPEGGGALLLMAITRKTTSKQMKSINIYGRIYLLSTHKEHHIRQVYDK
jgi:hypothetical protein